MSFGVGASSGNVGSSGGGGYGGFGRGGGFHHRGRGFGHRGHHHGGHGHHHGHSGGAGTPGAPTPFKHFPSKLALEYLESDGKRLRKSSMRKTIDYNAPLLNVLEARLWQRDYRDRRAIQPDVLYFPSMFAPSYLPDVPTNAVSTRFVRTATNKHHSPVFCMAWTPEGRRLITGTSTGEFTLWNGLTFNFETILQVKFPSLFYTFSFGLWM
jgi:polyadenylation factor subunit 2